MVVGFILAGLMTVYGMACAFTTIVEEGGPPEPDALAEQIRGALWYAGPGVSIFITGLVVLIIGCRRQRRAQQLPQTPTTQGEQ